MPNHSVRRTHSKCNNFVLLRRPRQQLACTAVSDFERLTPSAEPSVPQVTWERDKGKPFLARHSKNEATQQRQGSSTDPGGKSSHRSRQLAELGWGARGAAWLRQSGSGTNNDSNSPHAGSCRLRECLQLQWQHALCGRQGQDQ